MFFFSNSILFRIGKCIFFNNNYLSELTNVNVKFYVDFMNDKMLSIKKSLVFWEYSFILILKFDILIVHIKNIVEVQNCTFPEGFLNLLF